MISLVDAQHSLMHALVLDKICPISTLNLYFSSLQALFVSFSLIFRSLLDTVSRTNKIFFEWSFCFNLDVQRVARCHCAMHLNLILLLKQKISDDNDQCAFKYSSLMFFLWKIFNNLTYLIFIVKFYCASIHFTNESLKFILNSVNG